MVLGLAVLAANALAAGWGAVVWLRREPRWSIGFWPVLRVAQAVVAVQVVIGLARRVTLAEVGVMTVGALLIVTLSLRAYQTGG